MTLNAAYQFCFSEDNVERWWEKDAAFDALLGERFESLLLQAAAGELYTWRSTAKGRLMEVMLLDQCSRNIYRGSAKAWAQDAQALALAQEAVAAGVLTELNEQERIFLLMPYMHSESCLIHQHAEQLFKQYAPTRLPHEIKHKVIIDRFGRYPHRNIILGRASTAEELEFLTQPDSSF